MVNAIKKLKGYDTDKEDLRYALWNFGNSTYTVGVVPKKTVCTIFCKTEIAYAGGSMTNTWNTWMAIIGIKFNYIFRYTLKINNNTVGDTYFLN